MPERSTHAHVTANPPPDAADPPPPEVAEFIRFCHRRRPAVWPELYDVMCGVAARREFKGLGPDQLAERGLSFALSGMPRLANWVRATLPAAADRPDLRIAAHSGA
jgi:hypothetical protein